MVIEEAWLNWGRKEIYTNWRQEDVCTFKAYTVVTRFKECCFELLLRKTALVRFPMGEMNVKIRITSSESKPENVGL